MNTALSEQDSHCTVVEMMLGSRGHLCRGRCIDSDTTGKGKRPERRGGKEGGGGCKGRAQRG